MANLLTITKEANDYFTFELNGDSINAIKNTRNDLTMVGIKAHFKTSNGANLIKEQNVDFGNITIIDGVTTLIPTSPDDLFTKLISVNFFDWITGAGGAGSTTYEGLTDTEPFFGQDGRVPVVNEAQLRLDYTDLPDTSMLSKFPSTLVANKILQVNNDASGYIFIDLPAGLSTVTSIDFGRLLADNDTFLIPEGKTALWMTVNDAPWYPETVNNTSEYNTFTQVGQDVTTKTPLETGNYIVIFYQ